MDSIKVASLFCGCGGTDVGLSGGFDFLGKRYAKNDIELVYANDIDENACAIFEENFDFKPDNRDIREVKSTELPDFDILIGGFPCQSFSIVAQNPKRLGVKDDRGKLFFEMCRLLKERRPKAFIAENVKGILTANGGEAFPLILDEFKNCGYNVRFKVIEAVKYGVPQKRERVIIVGFRDDLDVVYFFPEAVLKSDRDYQPLSKVLLKDVPDKYYFSQKAVDGMLKNRKRMNKGRAQDVSKPCNTVAAHLAKVSLNSTDPVLLVDGRYRRFTPREVARIQSFPDKFKLVGSESAQYRALGNAVPPVMMWYIGKSVCDVLRKAKPISENERAAEEKLPSYREYHMYVEDKLFVCDEKKKYGKRKKLK